jgi:hypothetical protein
MSDDNPFQEEVNDAEIPSFYTPPPKAISPSPSFPKPPQTLSKLEQLRAREAELLRRQQELREARAEVIASPNFPRFYPVLVFDLNRDIPARAHSCLQNAVYGLLAIIASVVFNVFAVLCVWGLRQNFHHVRSMIFALIQGFGTVYLVFNYSFLRLYDACKKKDIPFSWIVIQFIVVGWTVYLTIGFPDSGSVGLATFLDLMAKSRFKFSMLMSFVNTLLIATATFFEFLTLYKAQAYQKVSGQDDVPASHQP